MDETAINERLRLLIKEIAGLSKEQQEKLAPLIKETQQRHDEIKQQSSDVEKSLQDLRIVIQYTLLDLEATRREANALRKRLTDETQPDDEDGTQS